MGNAEFELPSHVRQQWMEYLDGERQLFKNKITSQVFQLMVLSTSTAHNPISSFIQRSIYALPKTPKIIILNDQSGELFILVQQYESSLAREIPKISIFIDLLQFLKNIAQVVHSLFRKFGPFKITERMVGVDKNLEVMVWINQSKEKNQVQFSYQSRVRSQHFMIQNLVRLVQQYTYFNGYLECLLKENNFSAFIAAISQLINSKKIEIMKGEGQRPKTRPTRVLTPEYPYELKKELSSKGINFNDSPVNLKKRPSIPNFIKVIKEKKVNLLDSINHKRTFTREDGEANKNIKAVKKKQISDYSNELSQVRSLKDSPMKSKECHFSHSNLSKLSKNPSNTETSEQLTSSQESIARIIKRRDFKEKSKNKTCFEAPLSQTHGTISTKNIAQKTQSFLFLSSHKSPQKVNLVNLCKNTTQSKYFQTSKQQKSIIKQSEEENMRLSKMLQQQLDGFFTPTCKAPPLWVQVVQNPNLRQQFKKIIDF